MMNRWRVVAATSIKTVASALRRISFSTTKQEPYELNRMAKNIQKLEEYVPTSYHSWGYTAIFNTMVKLAGTAGLRVRELSPRHVSVYLPNNRRIRNHIGGLHACSMTLAAESATGMVVGMNVPDTHLPLIKSMEIRFVRRCVGGVTATATLSDEDYARIHNEDRGDVTVPVTVKDESGNEPIEAIMKWAWIRKSKK